MLTQQIHHGFDHPLKFKLFSKGKGIDRRKETIAHRMHKQLTFDEVQILALQLSPFTTTVQQFCILALLQSCQTGQMYLFLVKFYFSMTFQVQFTKWAALQHANKPNCRTVFVEGLSLCKLRFSRYRQDLLYGGTNILFILNNCLPLVQQEL